MPTLGNLGVSTFRGGDQSLPENQMCTSDHKDAGLTPCWVSGTDHCFFKISWGCHGAPWTRHTWICVSVLEKARKDKNLTLRVQALGCGSLGNGLSDGGCSLACPHLYMLSSDQLLLPLTTVLSVWAKKIDLIGDLETNKAYPTSCPGSIIVHRRHLTPNSWRTWDEG